MQLDATRHLNNQMYMVRSAMHGPAAERRPSLYSAYRRQGALPLGARGAALRERTGFRKATDGRTGGCEPGRFEPAAVQCHVDGRGVVQVGLGEGGGDGVGGLARVVVRDRAVDVVRHVRRTNLVVEPVEDGPVRPVDGEEGATHVGELVVGQVGHLVSSDW